VKEAFRRLAMLIATDGLLLACYDHPAVQEIVGDASCRVISYGDAADNVWTLQNYRARGGHCYFEPCYKGRPEGEIELGAMGRHNVKNALAVYALCRELGIDRTKLVDGFASFAGVKRRQEIKGEWRGVLVIDDFAHHPTAVSETIAAVKDAFPGRRLWAVFEPRSNTSRRNIFEDEFAAALALGDRVIVAGIHQPEKIPDADRLSVQRLVDSIDSIRGQKHALLLDGASEIAAYLGRKAQSGDIILVMSNGGFGGVQEKILAELAA
jgi:UDP-N-acetylmuramate: L-alanyl-gamma-D-glutamyl-meso-diaminopimelate ligase